MCYNQNIDQINQDFEDFQNELIEREKKLRVNTKINIELSADLQWIIEQDEKNFENY